MDESKRGSLRTRRPKRAPGSEPRQKGPSRISSCARTVSTQLPERAPIPGRLDKASNCPPSNRIILGSVHPFSTAARACRGSRRARSNGEAGRETTQDRSRSPPMRSRQDRPGCCQGQRSARLRPRVLQAFSVSCSLALLLTCLRAAAQTRGHACSRPDLRPRSRPSVLATMAPRVRPSTRPSTPETVRATVLAAGQTCSRPRIPVLTRTDTPPRRLPGCPAYRL